MACFYRHGGQLIAAAVGVEEEASSYPAIRHESSLRLFPMFFASLKP